MALYGEHLLTERFVRLCMDWVTINSLLFAEAYRRQVSEETLPLDLVEKIAGFVLHGSFSMADRIRGGRPAERWNLLSGGRKLLDGPGRELTGEPRRTCSGCGRPAPTPTPGRVMPVPTAPSLARPSMLPADRSVLSCEEAPRSPTKRGRFCRCRSPVARP